MATLRTPALDLGSFYFSGTQTVYKGYEVAWILDDIFAFKTMEDCRISANKSPFIEIQAGQTFIIRKGMTYIFDRETVIGLAYPQDKTEDLIIENIVYNTIQNDIVNNLENEILNNNNNYVTVEAYDPPVAKITAVSTSVILGATVSLKSQSYAISPATIASYQWAKNGTNTVTTSTYSYVSSAVGSDDIMLTITDSNGKKSIDTKTIGVTEASLPTAKISLSATAVTIGATVTMDGLSSLAGTGTITGYEWKINGVVKTTYHTFNWPSTPTGQATIQLKVTNSYGKVAYATAYVQVGAAEVIPDIVVESEFYGTKDLNEDVENDQINALYSTSNATGLVTITVSIPVKAVLDNSTARVRIKKNGTQVAFKDTYIKENNVSVCTCTYSYTGSIYTTDEWTATLQEVSGSVREYSTGVNANGSSNQGKLSVTKRTV